MPKSESEPPLLFRGRPGINKATLATKPYRYPGLLLFPARKCCSHGNHVKPPLDTSLQRLRASTATSPGQHCNVSGPALQRLRASTATSPGQPLALQRLRASTATSPGQHCNVSGPALQLLPAPSLSICPSLSLSLLERLSLSLSLSLSLHKYTHRPHNR
jgi:hypothetical protein